MDMEKLQQGLILMPEILKVRAELDLNYAEMQRCFHIDMSKPPTANYKEILTEIGASGKNKQFMELMIEIVELAAKHQAMMNKINTIKEELDQEQMINHPEEFLNDS